MNSNYKLEIDEKTDKIYQLHQQNKQNQQIYLEKIKTKIGEFKENYQKQIETSFKSLKERQSQLESQSEEIIQKKEFVEDQMSLMQEIQQIQAEYQKLYNLQIEEYNQENDQNVNLQNFIEYLNTKIQVLDEELRCTVDNKEKLLMNNEFLKYISGILLQINKEKQEIKLILNQTSNPTEKTEIIFQFSTEKKKIVLINIEPKIKNQNTIAQLYNLDGNYHELICRVFLALKQK